MTNRLIALERARRANWKKELFLADREAILSKKLTPEQMRLAVAQIEAQYGFDWKPPE